MKKPAQIIVLFSTFFCMIADINAMEKNMEKESIQFPKHEKSWDIRSEKEEGYNDTSKLFNTSFLADSEKVETLLLQKFNFKKDSFKTPDGLTLECLVRIVKNPAFTIIVSAGFLPGKMTGMATLVAMLPENCNIIFYNNRGKGNSEGKLFSSFLWSGLRNYGVNEYKDVMGALTYAQNNQPKNTPVFMYGICAGALNTAKALCKLKKQNKLSAYSIKGLILDSAVTSAQSDLENIAVYKYPDWSICNCIKSMFLWSLRYTIFHRWLMAPEKKTSLDPIKLAKTKIPTLHFNCKSGDTLTTYERTNKFYKDHKDELGKNELGDRCINKFFLKSKHAIHHIKHKEEYAPTLANFIEEYIRKE